MSHSFFTEVPREHQLIVRSSTASEWGRLIPGCWYFLHSKAFSKFPRLYRTIRRAARPALSSLQRNFCSNKLHKWLSVAIRRHAACLTRRFVSDTRELLWRLAARLRVFVWALLWGFAGVGAVRWFRRHCDPANRGHMARQRWWGCCSWITHSTLMEPCWISVVVHSPIAATIHQAEAILSQSDNPFFLEEGVFFF